MSSGGSSGGGGGMFSGMGAMDYLGMASAINGMAGGGGNQQITAAPPSSLMGGSEMLGSNIPEGAAPRKGAGTLEDVLAQSIPASELIPSKARSDSYVPPVETQSGGLLNENDQEKELMKLLEGLLGSKDGR